MKLALSKVCNSISSSNRTSVGNIDYMVLIMTGNFSALFFNENLDLPNLKNPSPQQVKG